MAAYGHTAYMDGAIPVYSDEQWEPTAYVVGPGTIWLGKPAAPHVFCDYCKRLNTLDTRQCEGCGAPITND